MSSERKSNTSPERTMLLEHWKNPIAVLLENEYAVVNGVMEIFLTTESLNQRMEQVEDRTPYSYLTMPVVKALDACIRDDCDGLLIHGLAPEELYISKEDLMKISSEIETIVILMKAASKEVDRKKTFEELQNKKFWILGRTSETALQNDEQAGFETVRRKDADFDAVRLFLTARSAYAANSNKRQINQYRLSELVSCFGADYGFVIDPQEEYGIEFSLDEISGYIE